MGAGGVSESPVEKRAKARVQQERTILDVTELICKVMEEQGLARAGLARRLNKTTHQIDEMLDGRRKMDIRTIADIFTAMDREVRFWALEITPPAPRCTSVEVTYGVY